MPPPQPQRPLSDKGDLDEIGDLRDRKTWLSGILVQFSYTNAHHDPHPICIVLYADRRYTHAVNVSYLNGQQRRQFKASLRLWVFLDPRLKYYWLKTYNKSCLVGYRTYFSGLLHPLTAWPLEEVKDSIPGAMALIGDINGIKPTDWGKFKARAVQAAKARDVVMSHRPSARANQQRPSNRPNARPLQIRVQEAIRRAERGINAGSVRPPPLRPASQRPGG
jgi:hypothetical protein